MGGLYAWKTQFSSEARTLKRLGHSSGNVSSILELRTKREKSVQGIFTGADLAAWKAVAIEGVKPGKNCNFDLIFGANSEGRKSCLEINYAEPKYGSVDSAFDDFMRYTGWNSISAGTSTKEYFVDGETFHLPWRIFAYQGESGDQPSYKLLSGECLPKAEMVKMPKGLKKGSLITNHVDKLRNGPSYHFMFNFMPHPECYKPANPAAK